MIYEHPLFMTLLTLAIFRCWEIIHTKSGNIPFLNPVFMSICSLVAILMIFEIDYENYFSGTEILHLLMAPAIIALAVPLYQNLTKAKEMLPLVILTITISGSCIIVLAIVIGIFFQLPDPMLLALSTKSVSAPIALEIAELSGATTALTIISVFSTGLLGVIIVPTILNKSRVKEESIQGLILGITSHAFGISRALAISPLAAAFATMGMALMGCFAVIAVPLFLHIFGL